MAWFHNFPDITCMSAFPNKKKMFCCSPIPLIVGQLIQVFRDMQHQRLYIVFIAKCSLTRHVSTNGKTIMPLQLFHCTKFLVMFLTILNSFTHSLTLKIIFYCSCFIAPVLILAAGNIIFNQCSQRLQGYQISLNKDTQDLWDISANSCPHLV